MSKLKQLNRKNNGSMKWDLEYIQPRFGTKQTKVYPLFIADMDYQWEPTLLDKYIEYCNSPDFGYFHVQKNFYDAVVNWYEDIHQLKLEKEWIVPSVGTVTSMHFLTNIFSKNQGVLYFSPVYGPFSNCAKLGNPVSCFMNLGENLRYWIDWDKLEQSIVLDNITTILFCNPHNPSGQAWSRKELEKLMCLVRKYDLYLFSDEIHGDLYVGQNRFISMIDLANEEDKVAVCTSANKTFNLSGLTTSYILTKHIRIQKQVKDFFSQLHIEVNRMGIEMTTLCYQSGRNWLEILNEQIKENISLLQSILGELPMCQVILPDYGYLVWVKLSEEINSELFVDDLAEKTGVLLEKGSRFKNNYDQFIRINVATDPQLLEEALSITANFLNNY